MCSLLNINYASIKLLKQNKIPPFGCPITEISRYPKPKPSRFSFCYFYFLHLWGGKKKSTSSPTLPPAPNDLPDWLQSSALVQILITLNLYYHNSIPPGPSSFTVSLSKATLHVPSELWPSLNTFCITFHPCQEHTMTSCFLCIDAFNFPALC